MAGSASKPQQKKQTPAVPPQPVEITIHAEFADPWSSEADEVQAMRDKRWEPSNATFWSVCRVHTSNVQSCDDFESFAGPILVCAPQSVRRINLVTHSKPGLFALAGYLSPGATSIGVLLGVLNPAEQNQPKRQGLEARQLDQALLNWLNDPADVGKTYRDQIRDRLRNDAQFWIYGCHGGAGQGMALLIEIAQTFHVDTYGFHAPVQYDPLYSPVSATPGVADEVKNRRRTYYQSISTVKEGFKHLASDAPAGKPQGPTK